MDGDPRAHAADAPDPLRTAAECQFSCRAGESADAASTLYTTASFKTTVSALALRTSVPLARAAGLAQAREPVAMPGHACVRFPMPLRL